MKVSVLIVNWNGLDVLPECLTALRAQRHQPHQIVVVDNGSTDGSSQWLEEQEDIETRCLPDNTGFAGGNNAGLPLITGDLIALLNNDARPDPGWIEAAVPTFTEVSVGMVACKIVRDEEPGVIDKVGHLIYPDGLNRGRGTGQPDGAQFNEPAEALWPDGCAGFYRRSAIEETGFFDEDFFLYGEDADLGFRLRWAGYHCIYQPGSLVRHRQSSSLGRFSPKKIYYIERNRWWVLAKNFPARELIVSPWYSLIRYTMNVISLFSGRGSAAGFQKDYPGWKLALILLKASWDGVRGLPRMLAKRKRLVRNVSNRDIRILLKRFRISAREIALND